MISIEDIRSQFSYNPETGLLSRISTGKPVICVGKTGYGRVSINGKQHKIHRIIWMHYHGEAPDQIDHINGDRFDNRIVNLRSVTKRQNSINLKLRPDNKSGCHGVNWHHSNRWIAQIRDDGKYVYLGSFANLDDAVAARKSGEVRLGYHENHGMIRKRYDRD